MITEEQTKSLAKKFKINESTILREYFQLLFLSKLYSFSESQEIFFKGGTALHMIYDLARFSEDLDFTVELAEKRFDAFIKKVFDKLTKEEEIDFKERKTITGKRFLMIGRTQFTHYPMYINLDFSFREKIFLPKKSMVLTDFPVLFTAYVYHLAKEEILAEKIRAIMTRKKGRDLYDIWFLLTQKTELNKQFIEKKLSYYQLYQIEWIDITKRIRQFSERDFIQDLKPFIPLNQRDTLGQFFNYLKEGIEKALSETN